MPNRTLSEARIKTLKPRRSSYEVRDAKLKGFGVRVLPSGAKRFYVHAQHNGIRVWKTVADVDNMTLEEARSQAEVMLGSYRGSASAPISSKDTLFESVAEAVFRRYARIWKPRTLEVNRSYLRRQILPWFAGRQIADIGRRDVQRWFACLRATPSAANRSAPVLSVIFKEAALFGYRPEESNPCLGLRRYRSKGRERYLSDDELTRLAATLSKYEAEWPLHVAAVRMLVLTGCRRDEIQSLRWSDYRDGHLYLRDSKSGPRTVWLSSSARRLLERVDHRGIWLFQASRVRGRPSRGWLTHFWRRVCDEANLSDVRLHDLRHTYATFALRKGENVLAISRLLGHASPEITLKYTHLADTMVREAAEATGVALEGEQWLPLKHIRLTEAAITRLRACAREYTVWDSQVPGLGVRVRPNGGASYILLRKINGRSRRVSLGSVKSQTVESARRCCYAVIGKGDSETTSKTTCSVPLFREFVVEQWKAVHFPGYKPSTRKCASGYLTRQLLPAFGSTPLNRITSRQVLRWFSRYSQSAPGGANTALRILRAILNFAIACGHIETNPTLGVQSNRREARNRFLSRDEIRRLHRVLDEQSRKIPAARQEADIIRVLLLTGCRMGEILNLRWCEVDGDMLATSGQQDRTTKGASECPGSPHH